MIMFVFYPAPEMPMNRRIVELLTASFFSGLIYYAGLLPFLILLLSNSFWRKRFEAVMGIRTQIPIEPSLPYKKHLDIPSNQNIATLLFKGFLPINWAC